MHWSWGQKVKCQGHRFIKLLLARSVWDIRNQKFVLPKKWAKIHQNRLRPAIPLSPHQAKFHRDRWNHLAEKRYESFFTPFHILAPRGTPGPNVTCLGNGIHQPPSSYLQTFVPFRRPLSDICATKLRRFCCQRDPKNHIKNHKKTHSKRYVSSLHAVTKSEP